MTKVGFVGLGSMGAPLARLIAKGDFDLTVCDPFPAALAPFEGVCRTASTAHEAAAGADILCICVRDDAQVRDVLFGENGAAAALKGGALVLIHSTISVAALREIAATLAGSGVTLIDAPVSRTRQTTDDRFVFTMMGGDADVVARARPVVESFATDIGHMGPLGAGMATKIANNMVTWMQITAAVQAADMAVCDGVELEQLLSVMRANGNLTPTMNAIISGKFAVAPPPERLELLASQGGIGEKDLALAIDTADRLGIDTSVMVAAQQRIRSVMSDPVVARRG